MPFQLAVVGHQTPPRTLSLKPGVNLVGRAARSDVQLSGGQVSRTHAKLVVEPDGKVQLYDLDSHNGVFVNGEKIRIRALNAGEHVYIGGFRLTLEQTEATGPTALGDSLQTLPVPVMTLQAVDAARRGQAPAFQGRDAAARNLAALSRASELLCAATSTAASLDALLGVARDGLRASHVALLSVRAGGMLALSRMSGDIGGDPPLIWPALQRAKDARVLLVSRDRPVETDLLPLNVLGGPAALLVVPLVDVEADRTVGALQVIRPHTAEGFADAEVDTALVLAHLMSAQLAAPQRAAPAGPDTATVMQDDRTETTTTQAAMEMLALGGGLAREDVRAALLKSVPEELADRVLGVASGQAVDGVAYSAGEQVVVFYDLQGFEAYVASAGAEAAARVVGQLAATAASVAGAFGGRLDQALGAAGFLRFWDGGVADASQAALRAALELRERLKSVVGGSPMKVRAGVDAGVVLAGVFGDGGRSTYTMAGTAPRVAERLAEMAGAGELLVTGAVRTALADRAWRLVALGPHALRGRSEVVDLFRVDGTPPGAA